MSVSLPPDTELKDYEILSRDAVRQLHGSFRAAIEKKAQAALPDGAENPDTLRESLKSLLIAATRKQIEIRAEELTELAKNGEEAIAKKASDIEHALHARCPAREFPSPCFSKYQKEQLAQAARERYDDPAVLRLFGDADRIYLRPGNIAAEGFISDAHRLIAEYLATKEYSVTDYNAGYATDKQGKQQFKIGKLLKDNADLYKLFIEDTARTSASILVVISRNADDIAYLSTGRAWSSCMGSKGDHYKALLAEIKQGALIAYMISERDPDIHNPLARISIKPFRHYGIRGKLTFIARKVFNRENNAHLFLPVKTYGLHNDTFCTTVSQFIESKLNRGMEGRFRIMEEVYPDGLWEVQKRNKGVMTPEKEFLPVKNLNHLLPQP